jgi:hypothetical protein
MKKKRKYNTTCPKCRRVQYTPHCGNADCNHCNDGTPPAGKKRQTWVGGYHIACPYCGFVAPADYWEDRDITSFLKSENVKSFGELHEKRQNAI